jgi:hypothetical protein
LGFYDNDEGELDRVVTIEYPGQIKEKGKRGREFMMIIELLNCIRKR